MLVLINTHESTRLHTTLLLRVTSILFCTKRDEPQVYSIPRVYLQFVELDRFWMTLSFSFVMMCSNTLLHIITVGVISALSLELEV